MTGKNNLFVYGTLMSDEVMHTVTGHHFPGTPSILDDFQRFSIHGADFPGIRQVTGKTVPGLIYQDIPEHIWPLLDEFEGDMYERIKVMVTTSDQIQFPAFTYVMTEQFLHLLTDLPWSFDTFIQQHKRHFLREC